MSADFQTFFDNIATDFSEADVSSAVYGRIADSLYHSLFFQQKNVVDDPCRRKAVLCPRRAGKSWTAMSYAFLTCLRKPDRRVVIVTLTLKHARNIYWTEMKALARQLGLTLNWNGHELWITFGNGSLIMLLGGESIQEIEKLRGGKYDLVVIDECKSYASTILNELVNGVVWPALGDRLGTLMMIGTPGNILKGLFFQATQPGYEIELKSGAKRPVSKNYYNPEPFWVANPENKLYWSRHGWTRKDNVTEPHLWDEALETKALNEWADDHPYWRREYLAEWVAVEDAFIFQYANVIYSNPALVQWRPDPKNTANFGLPAGHDWRFVCGVDLGFEDDWAIVVLAYSMTNGHLYQVFDYKTNHEDIDAISKKILEVYGLFNGFDAMVGDFGGLGVLVMETLNKRYGLSIQKAEKREKFDHIELVNSDFLAGRIKIIPGTDLDSELQTLQWNLGEDEDKGDLAARGKLKPAPGLPDHLCDALLYAWRFCHHFWSTDKIAPHAIGSPEWQKQYELQAMERLAQRNAGPFGLGQYDPLQEYISRGN